MSKTKAFDCVEMKRRGARRIYELTKDMTHEELLAFWQARDEELRKAIEEAKAKKQPA